MRKTTSYYDMSDWEHHADLNIAMNKSLEDIVSTVRSRIIHKAKEAFNVDLAKHSDLLSFMWNEHFNDYTQKVRFENAGKIAALNILGLGLQSEYISLKYLKNQPYMPKLYGTCGSAYFVEYAPSLVRLGYVLLQSKVPDTLHFQRQFPSWAKRTIVALRLLQLIRTLDTKLESPLYHCDFNPHNLGLQGEDEITLLDTDSIRFGGNAVCDSDHDCKWQDCEGTCNMTSRTCLHNIKTIHLQIICDTIFISKLSWFGLLRNPPRRIATDLADILQECAYPTSHFGANATVKRSSEEVLNKLESILLSSL